MNILNHMKARIFTISIILIIFYFVFNSLEFLLINVIDSYLIFEKILLIIFNIANLIVFIFLSSFFKENSLKLPNLLALITIVGLVVLPLGTRLDNYFSFLPQNVDTVILIFFFIIFVGLMMSVLTIKQKDIFGLKEIKAFAKWFLLSILLATVLNFILIITNNSGLTSLSLLTLIIPYLFISQYELKLDNKPAANN